MPDACKLKQGDWIDIEGETRFVTDVRPQYGTFCAVDACAAKTTYDMKMRGEDVFVSFAKPKGILAFRKSVAEFFGITQDLFVTEALFACGPSRFIPEANTWCRHPTHGVGFYSEEGVFYAIAKPDSPARFAEFSVPQSDDVTNIPANTLFAVGDSAVVQFECRTQLDNSLLCRIVAQPLAQATREIFTDSRGTQVRTIARPSWSTSRQREATTLWLRGSSRSRDNATFRVPRSDVANFLNVVKEFCAAKQPQKTKQFLGANTWCIGLGGEKGFYDGECFHAINETRVTTTPAAAEELVLSGTGFAGTRFRVGDFLIVQLECEILQDDALACRVISQADFLRARADCLYGHPTNPAYISVNRGPNWQNDAAVLWLRGDSRRLDNNLFIVPREDVGVFFTLVNGFVAHARRKSQEEEAEKLRKEIRNAQTRLRILEVELGKEA